ncbi:uncharacterized protein [Littorina saxatilis]|uniref:Exonuclease domain-containing protein n=1 Tax=Littorina saxatilis TaxID=31220 RepID=A0AAN9BVS4_9CAEN
MSSFSGNLSQFVSKSKKDKRLESKKMKALALLKLIESNHDVGSLSEKAKKEPPAKKARLDAGHSESSEKQEAKDSSSSCSSDSDDNSLEKPPASAAVTDDAEYAKVRQVLRAQQKWAEYDAAHGKTEQQTKKALRNGPTFSLTPRNLLPFAKLEENEAPDKLKDSLPPLFIADLQHLLLLALLQKISFWAPRWCRLVRSGKLTSVVLVVLKDVSIQDFEDNPDSFPFLKNGFKHHAEMVSPTQYSSSFDQDMCAVPLSISQMKKYTNRKDVRDKILKLISNTLEKSSTQGEKEYTSDDSSCSEEQTSSSPEIIKQSCPDEKQKNGEEEEEAGGNEMESQKLQEKEQFPRTSLLLSTLQMMEEGYPMPVDVKNKRYSDYSFSNERYTPPSLTSPMFAVDCEMCQTKEREAELTRVSVVDERRVVVYDQLVKPYNKITNYLTRFSGMTEELLEPVTKRLEDVRKEISDLLPPDAILCGQSLWNDLNALKLFHPYVIDTSVVFNQSGDKKVKCGLRRLTYNFLGRAIQGSEKGHCSIEDAKATMDLAKLKLRKNIEFGDAMLGGVYFPDIKTYFNNPSQAQNVDETFSSHALLTDFETFPPSDVLTTSEQQPQCDQKPEPCMNSAPTEDSEHSTVNGRDRLSLETNSVGGDGLGVNGGTVRQEKGLEEGGDCGQRKTSKEQEVGGEKDMHQREVFFQQEGSTMMFSLFEVLADNKKSSGLVGHEDFVNKFQSRPKLECVNAEDDCDACTKALTSSREKDFTWLELRAFADFLPSKGSCSGDDPCQSEKRKLTFFQLDEQVRQFVAKLQERSLVTVVMTGRYSEGQHLNAATFVKIT